MKSSEIMQRVLVGVVIGLLIGSLGFLAIQALQAQAQLRQTITDLKSQATAEQKHTGQLTAEIDEQSKLQTAYIRCIANFFAQPNRTNLTIANLNNCDIVASGGSISGEPSVTYPYKSLPDNPVPVSRAQPKPSSSPTPAPSKSSSPTPSPSTPIPRPTPLENLLNLLRGL